MNADWSNFFSALAGGGIAGVATLWAQIINAKDQRNREQRAEATLIRGFVQAIADEVKSVWDRYEQEIGPHLRTLEDGQPAIPFPVHQSYFVVFDSNASLLGRILDRKLREQIISTYIEAKGFVDSLHYYERLVANYKANPDLPAMSIRTDGETYKEILYYSLQLKKAHALLEPKVKGLQDSLRAYLDCS